MTTQDRQAAVKTAGDRLENIETWMRRTFVATLVTAHLTAAMALIAAYGAYEYLRIKSVVSEAQATAAKSLDDFRTKMHEKTIAQRPGRMP